MFYIKKSALFLLLFHSILTFSQRDSIVNYLDNTYRLIEKDKASYTQTIVKKSKGWLRTVYKRDGNIKFQGIYKTKKTKLKTGNFKQYNENGKIKSITSFNEKGKKDGIYYYFNNLGEVITKGYYKNDKREGVWKYSDENKNNRARIIFKKGKVVTYKLWDENGEEFNEKLILWKQPKFKGGFKTFKKMLIKHLKKNNLKTNFIVKCHINEDGDVVNLSIVPELEREHEKIIISFFKTIKDIEPAILANRKVKYTVELPILLEKDPNYK
ncbi:hypothetical protein MC378_12285 [Polaribacter sp. MSW13]|uniref:MORN repeat variant n=1 Tax=Polaribacter marinus TaxID=2916838 RepID=A0A9X2AKD4_9FLAO|nr:hypothetical protein [Polaribacter marinus]MCI2229947.1 hypothetical protein [Polaribacter marinus]